FIVVLNKIDLVNLKNNKIQNRVKKLSSNNKNSKGYVHLVSAKDGTGLAELFTDIKINIILKLDKLIN
ncbi:MAG: Rab family GTPase, partial [Promethearchaeota archaeon]